MRSIGLPSRYGHVEETPDLEITVEVAWQSGEQKPDLHAADEFLPEHNIKDGHHERELDDRELERQRREYSDSVNSPVLPIYKPR